jgi:hypothetical protein
VQLSAQERQRRSDLARRLHAEGKLGGRGPARRSAEVRARRASELSAEIVDRHRVKIERAIVAGLESSSTAQRLKAAELALKMGLSSERLDVSADRVEHEHLDRQQLIGRIMERLTAPTSSGALVRSQLAAEGVVIEGQAVEIR